MEKVETNLIFMGNIKHYLELTVPEYMPMAFTTLLAGAVLTTQALPSTGFWFLAIALFCIVGAFNSFNAIADKDIDKINSPHRPIPSKKIKEHHALYFSIGLYVISLVLGWLVNPTAFIIILACVLLTAFYSYPKINLKKRFVFGTLTVTMFYAVLCFVAGWSLTPEQPFPGYFSVFLFVMGLGLAITKDFMDLPGDAFHMAHTIPVKVGFKKSILLISIIITIAFGVLSYAIISGVLKEKFLILLVFFPLMLFNIYSYKQYEETFLTTHLFRTTMVLIMVLEVAAVLLTLVI